MDKFKLAHINARSLSAGFNNIKENILENDYNIFLISETWLSDTIDNRAVEIEGYHLVRADRTGRGGGVGIYLKKTVQFELLEVSKSNFSEQLWIKILIHKKKYGIGVVYRPPNSNSNEFFEHFEDVIANILPTCDGVIAMGDININLLDLDNINTKRCNAFLDAFDLKQIITEPTRITSNKLSLIDVIFCSNEDDICSRGVDQSSNFQSDHQLIYCTLNTNKPRVRTYFKTYRDFANFNYNEFLQELVIIPFFKIYEMDNIDLKVTFFNDLILNIFDKYAPIKTARCTKPRAPWMTDNIKLMIRLRDQAFSRFKKSGNSEHYNYYKGLRNFTTSAIRNEKKAYLSHRIRHGNSKTLWKDLDNLNIYNKKKNIDIPLFIGTPDDINDYFINSVKNLCNYSVQESIDFYTNHSKKIFETKLLFMPLNDIEILNIINSISSDSLGYDKINITMVKYCCPHILPFVTHIINYCLENNVFPEIWKTSYVIPLPKTDIPTQLKDLRPISILPALSKVLEKAVSLQIKVHLEIYNILPQFQSGFRANHSCTTAVAHITDDIIKATDNEMLTALILLDYTKAFDCVNHNVLFAIFHYIGFSENVIIFFSNYLSNRKQIVKIQNNYSEALILESGVPQGSILGPLLFSIYTCNLHSVLEHCLVHCYADDTQLYYSFSPSDIDAANTVINRDIKALVQASNNHSLILNPNKSVLMLFGSRSQRNRYINDLNISIEGTSLQCVTESKNLGFFLDTDLRFKKHINNCIKRAFCNLKKIYASKDLLDKKTIQMLCDSLVLSHFSYGDVVYGPCLDVITSRRIQRIQNSCIRLICGLRGREHVSHKLKEIHWLNMANRRLLHASVFYHKVVITQTPPYLYNKIRFRTDVHNVNIRRKSMITSSMHKTVLYERCFLFNIYKVYNEIPADLKQYSKIAVFKMHMRKALFQSS